MDLKEYIDRALTIEELESIEETNILESVDKEHIKRKKVELLSKEFKSTSKKLLSTLNKIKEE